MADLLIATKAFCNTLKAGSFTGDTTMCPTRSQIEAAGLYIKKGYTYATDQLVPQDHIERLDWEYTFSVTPTTATISAAGGSQKFTVTSYKRQYSYSNAGNRIYVEGSQTNVGYTSSNSGSGIWTAANDTISYGANTGSTQPSGTITWTQSESFGSDPKKTATATHKQNADSIKPSGDGYSNPRITAFSYPTVIPAAGGNSTPSYSYEQTVYWVSGKTTTLTSGGTPTFNRTSGTATVNSSSGLANTGSKGTTRSGQTTVAVVSLTITMNGKSSSASSANVSQAENSYSDAWNTWVVTCTPNPTTISASGGTSTLSGTAHRDGTRTWSSGSTQPLDSGNQNVTSFSIVSPVSGFSISGAVVTANSNSSTSTRSVRVRGTYSGVNSPEATITQSAATTTTTTEYEFSVSPTSLSFTKDGGNQTVSIVSRSKPKYTNDINGEVSYGNWSAVSYTASSTNSAFSSTTPTGTGTNSASVSVGVNTGAARSATITYTQSGSGTKKTVSCSQAVGTQTRTVRDYSFSANPTSLSFDASGGTKSVTVTSQYRDGTQSSTDGGNNWSSTSWGSWQTASYTGTVDNTGGGAFSGSGNSVTAGANSSTSSRKGNLKLSQPRSGIQENGNSWPSPSNINVEINQKVGVLRQSDTKTVYSISTTPTSLNWDYDSTSGKSFSVTSRAQDQIRYRYSYDGGSTWGDWGNWQNNGSSYSASYNSSITSGSSYFSISGNTVTPKGSNTTFSANTGTVTVSNAGNTAYVSLSQNGAPADYDYRISISPSSYNFSSSAGSHDFTVTVEQRSKPVTSSSWDSWSTIGNNYSSSISGAGFSRSQSGSTVTVNVTSNTSTTSGRSGTLTVTCDYTSDLTGTKPSASASLTQDKYVTTEYFGYQYKFSVSPTSLSFSADGETKTYSVTSKRRQITKRTDSSSYDAGSWTTWSSYTESVSGTGFSGSSGRVTAGANSSTSSRSGDLDLTQTQSDKCTVSGYESDSSNINVPLNQDGIVIGTYNVSFDDMTYNFGTSTTANTEEALGSSWLVKVQQGTSFYGSIEITNSGNTNNTYEFFIDDLSVGKVTLAPNESNTETFSFNNAVEDSSDHYMKLEEI